MAKYNYEKKLTDFTCGWQTELDEARKKCPKGKVINNKHYPVDSTPEGKIIYEDRQYFYNPCKKFNFLESRFNDISAMMKQIIQDKESFTVEQFNEILKLDIELSWIIEEYTFEDGDFEALCENDELKFDNFELNSYDIENYFSFENKLEGKVFLL